MYITPIFSMKIEKKRQENDINALKTIFIEVLLKKIFSMYKICNSNEDYSTISIQFVVLKIYFTRQKRPKVRIYLLSKMFAFFIIHLH